MDKHSWPAWFYGPNGQSQVFTNEKDVPSGWADHPSKVQESKPAPTPKPASTAPVQAGNGSVEVDADGWPWSPELHAASKTKTQAGLWRMKVGAKRPAPKPGFPKLTSNLDL